MAQYISKDALVVEIKKEIKDIYAGREYVGIPSWEEREIDGLEKAIKILNTLEVKESDETAEAFARIIRANLTGIDKDVQYKFEQLYKEITGKKMYQGYND